MESFVNCIPCLIKKGDSLYDEFVKEPEKKYDFFMKILDELKNTEENRTTPYASGKIMRLVKKRAAVDDIYKKEKKFFNDKMLSMEKEMEEMVSRGEDKLLNALKLSSAGNIIDFGILDNITFSMVKEIIDKTLDCDFNKELYKRFKKELAEAKEIVYLGDNAGEIVFDKIFIKEIKKEYPNVNIIYVVRGEPVLNDVTEEDGYYVQMDKYATIVNNGTDLPGTDLPEICDELKEIMNRVPVIISKGQGNFESLYGCGKNIYYIFLCKCDLMAKKLGMKKLQNVFMGEI